MTIEEYILKNCGMRQYGEQDENGVDLSLIRENLNLSPEERMLKADRMRLEALEIRRYGERTREKQVETDR